MTMTSRPPPRAAPARWAATSMPASCQKQPSSACRCGLKRFNPATGEVIKTWGSCGSGREQVRVQGSGGRGRATSSGSASPALPHRKPLKADTQAPTARHPSTASEPSPCHRDPPPGPRSLAVCRPRCHSRRPVREVAARTGCWCPGGTAVQHRWRAAGLLGNRQAGGGGGHCCGRRRRRLRRAPALSHRAQV